MSYDNRRAAAVVRRARTRSLVVIALATCFLLWTAREGIRLYGRLPARIPAWTARAGGQIPSRGGAADPMPKSMVSAFWALFGSAGTIAYGLYFCLIGAHRSGPPGERPGCWDIASLPPDRRAYVVAPMREAYCWLMSYMAICFVAFQREEWRMAIGETGPSDGFMWLMFAAPPTILVAFVLGRIAMGKRARVLCRRI